MTVIVLVVLCLELPSVLPFEYARTLFKHSVSLKKNVIKFLTSSAIVREKVQDFREKSTIPNVLGAIDGTHILTSSEEKS